MKVLIASAEAAPFAKVGGLADVIGSLPAALRAHAIDARVVLPGYGFIEHWTYAISHLFTFQFAHRQGVSDIHVYTCDYQGVPFYFLQVWPYFGQEGTVYTDWEWDVPRFIFFNQAVMALAWHLNVRQDWVADVVHVNDWHTGLIPFLIHQNRDKAEWRQTASVVSIHNIAYQGAHIGGWTFMAGIDGRDHQGLQQNGLGDNMLGIAIAYSDLVSTVSPNYAREIQYPYAGFELADLIHSRQSDLVGILNGLDTDLWNPATDPKLAVNYNLEDFREKRVLNKRHLQSHARLPIRDDVPLVGMVTRLAWQKGLDMAIPALHQLLDENDMQFVILGTGEPSLERELWWLGQRFNTKARVFLQFDAALAQQIYAGCDIFLMPSHFEPCGMGQMIAMRYGALPLVRETGGLADTVINYDNGPADLGTGFTFHWEQAQAIVGTMRWALETYHQRRPAWERMQERGMTNDFSWTRSAQDYVDLYQRAIDKHQAN